LEHFGHDRLVDIGNCPTQFQQYISGFKLTGKDKVGDREAMLIEYALELPNLKGDVKCRLWLEPKTAMPIKRVLEVNDGNKVFRASGRPTRTRLESSHADNSRGTVAGQPKLFTLPCCVPTDPRGWQPCAPVNACGPKRLVRRLLANGGSCFRFTPCR
jgi:hypothetical protein